MLIAIDCRGQRQDFTGACPVVARRPIKAAIGRDGADAAGAESVVFDDSSA